jgi:hypothetical protein
MPIALNRYRHESYSRAPWKHVIACYRPLVIGIDEDHPTYRACESTLHYLPGIETPFVALLFVGAWCLLVNITNCKSEAEQCISSCTRSEVGFGSVLVQQSTPTRLTAQPRKVRLPAAVLDVLHWDVGATSGGREISAVPLVRIPR